MDETVTPEAVQTEEVQGEPTSTEPTAVQPEGQGRQEGNQAGPYDLSAYPEDVRSHLEQFAKEQDARVTREFQKRSETWKPYEDLGVQDIDPEDLGALLGFANQLNDPDAAKDAVLALAENLGIDLSAQPEAEAEEDPDPYVKLTSQVESLQERLDREDAEREAAAAISAQWAKVEETHGKALSDEEKEEVRELAYQLAANPSIDEPVTTAEDLIKKYTSKAQSELVKGSPAQPAPAEPGGVPSTIAELPDSFEEAERLHRERRKHEVANA